MFHLNLNMPVKHMNSPQAYNVLVEIYILLFSPSLKVARVWLCGEA